MDLKSIKTWDFKIIEMTLKGSCRMKVCILRMIKRVLSKLTNKGWMLIIWLQSNLKPNGLHMKRIWRKRFKFLSCKHIRYVLNSHETSRSPNSSLLASLRRKVEESLKNDQKCKSQSLKTNSLASFCLSWVTF